jgi:hypothetical protein
MTTEAFGGERRAIPRAAATTASTVIDPRFLADLVVPASSTVIGLRHLGNFPGLHSWPTIEMNNNATPPIMAAKNRFISAPFTFGFASRYCFGEAL